VGKIHENGRSDLEDLALLELFGGGTDACFWIQKPEHTVFSPLPFAYPQKREGLALKI